MDARKQVGNGWNILEHFLTHRTLAKTDCTKQLAWLQPNAARFVSSGAPKTSATQVSWQKDLNGIP